MISCDNTTSTNESHASLSVLEKNNFPPYRLYFIKLARLDQFCKHALFGSPFCWRGSPLGPHFTENWVPILTNLGLHGMWPQWCLCCGKGAEVSILHSPIALWLTFYHFSESCNSVISISSQMRLHYRRCTFACLCSVDEGDLRRCNQNCIVKSIYFTKISLTEGGIKINRPENVIIFCLFRHLVLDLVRSKSNW